MNTYTIIILGPSGSGKTVLLSSLYKKLSTQGDIGFFLAVETEKRQQLIDFYEKVGTTEKGQQGTWPDGTKTISELMFTCKVQADNLSIHSACNFEYLDYAGGDMTGNFNPELDSKLKEADTLIGLLDGQQIRSLMRNEPTNKWQSDVSNMASYMQNSSTPIHFVISKWDLLEEEYTLGSIRDRLLQIEELKNLVNNRSKNQTIRLIPVSAVGKGFATLQPDGTMVKKIGAIPKPFQVEVPLACVLPDAIKEELDQLKKTREAEMLKTIEVNPNLSFWDKFCKVFAEGLEVVRNLLPQKYRFNDEILRGIINVLERPAKEKVEDAIKRKEYLRLKQAESIELVSSEETALNHASYCFLVIMNEFEDRFPDSNLNNYLNSL